MQPAWVVVSRVPRSGRCVEWSGPRCHDSVRGVGIRCARRCGRHTSAVQDWPARMSGIFATKESVWQERESPGTLRTGHVKNCAEAVITPVKDCECGCAGTFHGGPRTWRAWALAVTDRDRKTRLAYAGKQANPARTRARNAAEKDRSARGTGFLVTLAPASRCASALCTPQSIWASTPTLIGLIRAERFGSIWDRIALAPEPVGVSCVHYFASKLVPPVRS